jgi:hypothetical protein
MILTQRLRSLQLRLNSVDPGALGESAERVLNWRAVAGEAGGAEGRRIRVHAYVTGSVNAVTADFDRGLQRQFLPRLAQSFRSVSPELQGRADALSGMDARELELEYASRLKALERHTVSADNQLAELRSGCEDTYMKLAEVNERLDQIWANDDTESVGGWRSAIAKIRAEKAAGEKTPLQVFREDAFRDDEDQDKPGFTCLTCPTCHEATGMRQPRTGFMEDLAGVVGMAPYRCSRCMVRFYRYRPARKRNRV